MTFDGTNSYAYDGEGRMCAMATRPVTGGMVAYQYIYDADGNRVAKGTITLPMVNGQPTLTCDMTANAFQMTNGYIVNQNGQAVTELTYAAGQPTWSHSNVYAGGELLATYDLQGVHFHLTDWLGNRRVQANAALFLMRKNIDETLVVEVVHDKAFSV